MHPKNWFLSLRGESIGPLSEPLLLKLFRHGRVLGSDQVRQGENGEWRSVESCRELGITKTELAARVTLPDGTQEPVLDLNANAVRLSLGAKVPRNQEFSFALEAAELGGKLDLTGLCLIEGNGEQQTLWIELTRLNPAHRRRIQAYVQSQEDRKS